MAVPQEAPTAFRGECAEGLANAGLVRGVRRWDLLCLVLNGVVGAGIFGLPSRAFALAGSWSLAACLVAAVVIALILVCFAEVGSRFAASGGPYLYARTAFGPLVGFEVGWLMWLARVSAFAALCNLFVGYFGYFVPAAASGAGRWIVVGAAITCLTVVNVAGIRATTNATNLLTIGKLTPLLLLVAAGAFLVEPSRFSFAVLPAQESFSRATLLMVFAFMGFEGAVIPAGEIREPSRHVPFALFTSVGLILLLYLSVQAVCIGTLPHLADSERPLADAGVRVFGAAGAWIISAGALLSIGGTMNSLVFATPRILYAMAEQRQLPRLLTTIGSRARTPHLAILASSLLMFGFTLFSTFVSALTISTVIRLITFATTCAALPVLRRSRGASPPFSAPAGPFVAAVAIAVTVWLVTNSTWSEARLVIVASLAGLLLHVVLRARSRSAAPARP